MPSDSGTEHRCPTCDSPLQSHTLGDQTARRCANDHGVWLPAFALERALSSVRTRSRTAPPSFREAAVASLGPAQHQCPADGTRMDRAIWGDAVFARCSRCRGLWMDPDALAVVVAEVKGERVTPKVRDPEVSLLAILLSSL